MNLITISHLLLSGMIVGLIFFQTTLSAPIVFKYLSKDQSSIYIRKIFPKLFIVISIIGGLCITIDLLGDMLILKALIASITTFILPIICYLIVPATNKATDNGNKVKFKQLHALSVFLIVVVFFTNIFWPFI